MSALNNNLTCRLQKLLPRLASDSDGEVIATVRAIQGTLRAEGNDLHDLAASIGCIQIIKAACAAQIAAAPTWKTLSHHERGAWMTLILANAETTDFQRQRLSDMANKTRVGMHFSPHWRYVQSFDELVARLHAKGVRI